MGRTGQSELEHLDLVPIPLDALRASGQPLSVLDRYVPNRSAWTSISTRATKRPAAAARTAVRHATAHASPNWADRNRWSGSFMDRASSTPGARIAAPINGT